MRGKISQTEHNKLSVQMELQADFFAGVWAHYADKSLGVIEPGDIEEALNAASAIGDDKLQEKMQGRVVPDSFTHGNPSSACAGSSAVRNGDLTSRYILGEKL